MQDSENTDPTTPSSSTALHLHAFDLDQRQWSLVHTAGSIPFQKLEVLQCHASKLIAVGWTPGTGKADNSMQVSDHGHNLRLPQVVIEADCPALRLSTVATSMR